MRASVVAAAGLFALSAPPPHLLARGTVNNWPETDPVVSAWYKTLTQPDHPELSCCGEADAFEADSFEIEGDHYVAIITNGKGVLANGTRIPVPNAKMKSDKGNPTGHGVIFIGASGEVFCYVTPSGL
jgi:hypothetical protein